MDYGDEIYYDERFTKDIGTGDLLVISAVKAREMTKEVLDSCNTRELQKLLKEIYNAISEGKYEVPIEGTISKTAKDRLKELGYFVDCGSQYNQSYARISWKDRLEDE